MNRLVLALLLLVAGCARRVEVGSAPASQPIQNAIQLTNGLNQPVNVYVNYNGNDHFLQQVRANTALRLPVTNIPVGATVTLKAVTIDGTRTYQAQNVVLSGTYNFSVP